MKIWSKSVNCFKGYSNNKYVGQVRRHFGFGLKFNFNSCMQKRHTLVQFGENLESIGQLVQKMQQKQVSG